MSIEILFVPLTFHSTFPIEIPSNAATGLSASAESVKRPSLRRTSSREKQRWHRNSSRRNKENGTKGAGRSATATAAAMTEATKSRSLETIKTVKIVRVMTADQQQQQQQQPAVEKILDNSHNEIFEEHASKEARVPSRTSGDGVIGPQDCTEMDVKTFHVTLTYKPRI